MMRVLRTCLTLSILALAAHAQEQLRSAFPHAGHLAAYSASERAAAFQRLLHLTNLPVLGTPVSVTPSSPYAADGTHLAFWKPSFVLGTAQGGEAGVNFWGLHNDGHVNIAFTTGTAKTYALDCRLLSAGQITYKVYVGKSTTPDPQRKTALIENHLLLVVPAPAGKPMLVEMWPEPTTAVMGFLGCDLSTIGQ